MGLAHRTSFVRGLSPFARSTILKPYTTLAPQDHVTVADIAQKFAAIGSASKRASSSSSDNENRGGKSQSINWKVLPPKTHGLSIKVIDRSTSTVLKGLQRNGHEAYLVGGCVRDLLLGKTPKDFDILTTADPPEIRRSFSRCMIIGRRFPICHVHIRESTIEVSSFSTSEKNGTDDLTKIMRKPFDFSDRDYARWKNCMRRDFTINGLMYDPFKNVIYDYLGAIEDLKSAKVRTVIPAHTSFSEDCARILRAIRIAARLGFRFSRDTARAIQDCSTSVRKLDKQRVMMEMNYMLAYGAAEPSVRMLWRFGLLEILLPIQGAYLVSQGFRRRDKRSNLLLVLFEKLDGLLSTDRPCHNSLWVGLLTFHLALVDEPQDALVVTAFALCIRNGGNLKKAIKKARNIYKHANSFQPEIIQCSEELSDDEVSDRLRKLVSRIKSSLVAMMDDDVVSRAMSRYPQAPFSNVVFISVAAYAKVMSLFSCIGDIANGDPRYKKGDTIDYQSLVNGDIEESRFAFAKVVIEALYLASSAKEKEEKQEVDQS